MPSLLTGRFSFLERFRGTDWLLVVPIIIIAGLGLVTMNSFVEENPFFDRQLIWLFVGLSVMTVASIGDYRFLRRTGVVITLYVLMLLTLLALFLVGSVFQGAQSWFNLGFFAVQPSDPAKLIVIMVLAKYFSRRHVAIANIRHIIISGIYAFLIFLLVFLQPDFGSAIIIGSIWFGMVLVSGISKKHLLLVGMIALTAGVGLWVGVFEQYQKDRIVSFLNPLADIQGTGYNAYQSTIAVGSGTLLGKGVGYGTQSRLKFLPEYETDFIFAAYAEEWGFVGVLLLLGLFVLIFVRLMIHATHGASNFETLFIAGVASMFLAHITIHVGMNVGLLPVTGTTLPFMSYGGSHLITEFFAIGMILAMRKYAHIAHRIDVDREVVGV